MGVFERALQWLRSFVETKTWDYGVVWKLGDDPSRYIQWAGCCCSGAYGDPNNIKIKEESEEKQHELVIPLCRDTHVKHPANTNACGALSRFPSSIPLYSGIHGETVLSTEPRWFTCNKDPNSNQSHKSSGTQVLIPVVGGLVELFSTKHMLQDRKVIEFVTAQFDMTMEQESISAQSFSGMSPNEIDWPAPLEVMNFSSRVPFLPPVSQLSHHSTLEGSSIGSNPSNEHSCFNSVSVHVSPNVSVNGNFEKYPTYNKSDGNRKLASKLCANHLVDHIEKLKSRQMIEREQYHSKNLVTERKRRNRIKDGLFTLRALVPKITKMDRAAILGDAVDYIEELQKKVKELKDELGEMEDNKCHEKKDELVIPKLNANKGSKTSTPTKRKQDSSTTDENEKMEVQVEVYQIGTRDFFLKLLCNQKQQGFMRLMEAMNSLGLQVVDANITTCNGKVLNILKVEVDKMEVIQPKRLKDSLIQLVSKSLQQ